MLLSIILSFLTTICKERKFIHMIPLEKELIKSVIMIAQPFKDDVSFIPKPNEEYSAKPIGTGVLVGYKGTGYCVTAKHVIFNQDNPVVNPVMMTNNKDASKPVRGVSTSQLNQSGCEWVSHPDPEIDLTAIKFMVTEEDDCMGVFEDRHHSFNNIMEGSDVFIFGFPSSFSPREFIQPFIRQGCVGLKIPHRLALHGTVYPEKTVLLDASVTAGNSGSPVFTKPIIIPQAGGIQVISSRLCGIVSGHHCNVVKDFNKKAIGLENAGIGIVHSIDQLIPLLEIIHKGE